MSERNNPLQDPGILVVVGIVVLSAIGKCAKDVPEAPPPFVPSIFPSWQAIGMAISTYILPFLLVTAIVFGILWLVCRYAKMGAVHSHDFRQIALCISGLCAIAILYPGMPNPYDKWRYGVWAAILFGGPLSFWFLASTHIQVEDDNLARKITSPLNATIEKLKQEVSNSESETGNLVYQLREAREALARLQAVEKERSDREKENQKRKGILDSDDF